MKSPLLFLLILTPFLLESTGIPALAVSVPGVPLSLGGLGMVVFGLSNGLMSKRYSSHFFLAFLLIFLGALGGAFFSDNLPGNLSAATAQLLFVLAAYGVALELGKHNTRLFVMLDICMALAFLYWLYYVMDKTLLSGQFISYTKLTFTRGPNRAINHHVPGFHISVSAIYLATRFSARSKVLGYSIAGASIIACLLIESRSNTLLSAFALMWLITQHRNLNVWSVLVSGGAVLLIFKLVFDFLGQYDFLNQRFDAGDYEYQNTTNFSRIYLYQQFFPTFLRHPLGMGLENPRILYEYTYLNPHNHYLTFVLAGGIVSLAGVILFAKTFIRIIFGARFQLGTSPVAPYIQPIKGAALLLFATLLTIEFGGAIFSLGMVLLMYLEIQFSRQKAVELFAATAPTQA
jgi:hypothetical protein